MGWVQPAVQCRSDTFVFEGESFYSIDSFYEALKIPEGTSERATCAMSPLHEAQRLARRYGAAEFLYGGKRPSGEKRAICSRAGVARNSDTVLVSRRSV